MVSEVLVDGQLVPLFLDWSEAEYHNRSVWQSKVSHLMVAKKHRDKGLGQDIAFKNMPPVTY
jgi:hypothetical protein